MHKQMDKKVAGFTMLALHCPVLGLTAGGRPPSALGLRPVWALPAVPAMSGIVALAATDSAGLACSPLPLSLDHPRCISWGMQRRTQRGGPWTLGRSRARAFQACQALRLTGLVKRGLQNIAENVCQFTPSFYPWLRAGSRLDPWVVWGAGNFPWHRQEHLGPSSRRQRGGTPTGLVPTYHPAYQPLPSSIRQP
jgi:hypothetical protein